jgi:hypothetical protein
MSMSRPAILIPLLSSALVSTSALAQEAEVRDRFFSERVGGGEEMQVRGNLTSSTLVAPEIGGQATEGFALDNSSPVTRIYTELRAQFGVQNLTDAFDLRADARVRFVPPCSFKTVRQAGLAGDDIDCRFQSGTFGGNEYEIRELYGRRPGSELAIQGGRQFVTEIGATKLDGVRVQYTLDDHWSLIGFGGLAPSRISRSVLDDYAGGVLPIAAGAGGAYRYQRYFGSVGAAGIVPLSAQNADAEIQPRTFVTSSGYWRPSDMLDVYHFASIDLTGPSTDEVADMFTNISLGVNVNPVEDLRLTAMFHHFSTDTLEEYALEQLEENSNQNVIQNNVEVLRLAAQSARLGASLALMEKRFELSTSFGLRHRLPETLCPGNDPDCEASMGQTTREAWSGEAMVSLVDRHSIGGLRLGASVINLFGLYDAFGLGDDSYGRSNHLVGRINASRALMDEQLQIDADVSYLHAEDVGTADCMNGANAPLTCYGASVVDTVSLGGTFYYRFHPDWFAMLTANAALQSLTPDGNAATPATTSYSNTLITGFLRLAYRF